jgi:hypothetical protein
MGALVLKRWKAGSAPVDDERNHVLIEGRQGGLVSWLLARLRIDPSTTIAVGLERMIFTQSSLAGTESRVIPLEGICSSYYGYHKPWKRALLLFVLLLAGGLALGMGLSQAGQPGNAFTAMIGGLVLALLVSLVYYYLNRTLTLGFVEHSGVINGIVFKRSIIENVDIDHTQARAVCLLVQRLIELKARRALLASPPPRKPD